jgi:predicted deacetylase
MTATTASRRVVVAIHDVTPAHAQLVRACLDLCRDHDVPAALFVVPSWHGAWPLTSHGTFVDWLRAHAASGAEIFLHGERHDERGSPRGLRHHARAFGRTDGEGEFLALGPRDAMRRVDRGIDLLRRLGLPPIGFVPPAWLGDGGGACWAAARARGLAFGEDVTSVHLLGEGRSVRAPVVRWSARTRRRAIVSVTVAALRRVVDRWSGVVRIALHPTDLLDATVARSVAATLALVRRDAEPSRSAGLFTGAREAHDERIAV